ncbi:unnamed protein product, partial [Didymodactylos carnosus]
VERRVTRVLGEKSSEKYAESDSKIRDLQTQYKEKKSGLELLQTQIKILNEELRTTRRDLERLTSEKTILNGKFMEFDLYITL